MSDLNREDFEIWVKKRSASSPSGFYPQLLFRCALEPERYMISWVDSAFEGWQASRECLVVDLPKHAGLDLMSSEMSMQEIREDNRFNRALELAKKALTAAGVKYK